MLLPPLALVASALGLFLVLALGLVYASLDEAGRAQFAGLLLPRAALLVLAWMLAVLVATAALIRWWVPCMAALPELAEQTRALANADEPLRLRPHPDARRRELIEAINGLAAQRDGLREDIAAQVAHASANVRQERNRLATLMAELHQSVVVCNRDGRILLYNNRARMQFRALSHTPQLAGGAELIGIGRSIYAVFDRKLVEHALETVQQRLARGAQHPAAQFVVSTRRGQLLRVQMAAVTDTAQDAGGSPGLSGFLLMLDNITRSFDEQTARDRLLYGLIEKSRASLASTQAAVEMLGYEDLEPAMHERFLAVLRDEAATMKRHIDEVAARSARNLHTRWPLDDIRGVEFVDAAAKRLQAHCRRPVSVDCPDPALWLRLDSFSMLQALISLGERLVSEFPLRGLQLRLAPRRSRAQLDLVWTGHPMSNETVTSWELEPIRIGGEASPISVRDVLDRHDAEMWFERDRVRHQGFFRFLLPRAAARDELATDIASAAESRPDFFDFDLFRVTPDDGALDERPLSELAFTVFDVETTGLDAEGGDQIIQIGAARIVNCRLLRHECFEQLVDPGRGIPEAGISIHGITPEMVAGKPRIEEVLPAFHQYAQDTVLVGHNVAFDMKFLQALERRTGLAFLQPVLDTMLLSAVVHPNQQSHRLEAIAERFGIAVLGRHTALGDALVTAEILIRLIPLLRDMGIETLRQARAAAKKTYYARLEY